MSESYISHNDIVVISSSISVVKDMTFCGCVIEQIDTLSRVNHKNFVNLIGYCEEDEPFTRMMVFEYAPNGTLSEHLHGKILCCPQFSFNYSK